MVINKMSKFYKNIFALAIMMMLANGTEALSQDANQVKPDIVVTLKPIAIVGAKKVYLKDVAEIKCSDEFTQTKLEKIAVCGNILPAKPRLLSKDFIRSRIKQNRILPSRFRVDGAEQISVNLKTTELNREDFRKAVKDYINSLEHSENSKLEIIQLPDRLLAPANDLSIKVIPRKYGNYKGSLSLSLGVYNGNTLYKRLVAKVKRKVFDEAVVAIQRIQKGQVITQADIELRNMDVTGAGKGYCNDIALVIGKRSKSLISAEGLIQKKMIESDPILKKGDIVSIMIKKGTVQLTVAGEAKQDGFIGDLVNVRSSLNKTILRGVVKSSTLVVIQ